MIAPILSRKGTSKSGALPKEKAHNERTPFPREQRARTLRATQAPSAIAANSVSSAAAGPEPRGADDRPNSLKKKRTSKSGAFPKEKPHNERTSFPSRTERACSPPNV